MNSWGIWFREAFDKILLFVTFLITIWVVLHMAHDDKDVDQILWARELAGTVLGALLGLITGHALASSRASVPIPGGGTATVSTEGKS